MVLNSRKLLTQPLISFVVSPNHLLLFLSTLMAGAANTFVLSLLMFLLLQQHLDPTSASRAPPKAYLGKPAAPSLSFTINRYRKTETEAFRPTSPGHSPGVGHLDPPSGRP
ncbi:hypothetical protein HRI_003237500 [Hibiscus trionum]|uniref:Uncharacterized protein n=1 Tax=Hibiscus trionum TaxID=183268 RepID=A0A9W7IFS0_HIBTR|nr:hypothetical protein HRI_003237500 [Hibiscus trionum]